MSIEDDWGMDNYQGLEVVKTSTLEEVPLPKFLTDLRDGVAAPPREAGMARSRQLDKMAKDVADLQEFVEDLDRYAKHAKLAPLTGKAVGPYMERYIRLLRQQSVERGVALFDQLQYKRDHS